VRGSAGCSHAAALPAAADAPAPGRARQATLAALGGFAERERWCARLCSVRLLPGSGAGLTPGAGQGGCRRPAVARGRTGEAALQLNQRPGHCAAPRRQHAARRKAGQARRRRRGRRRGRAPPAAARHGARAGRSLGVHPAARRRTGRAVRPRPWPPALPIVPSWRGGALAASAAPLRPPSPRLPRRQGRGRGRGGPGGRAQAALRLREPLHRPGVRGVRRAALERARRAAARAAGGRAADGRCGDHQHAPGAAWSARPCSGSARSVEALCNPGRERAGLQGRAMLPGLQGVERRRCAGAAAAGGRRRRAGAAGGAVRARRARRAGCRPARARCAARSL